MLGVVDLILLSLWVPFLFVGEVSCFLLVAWDGLFSVGCLLASFISCMLGCLWLLLGGVGHLLFIDVCLLSSSDLLCLFVLFPYYFVLHFRMFTST